MPASLHLLAQCLSRTRMCAPWERGGRQTPSCSPCWLQRGRLYRGGEHETLAGDREETDKGEQ